MRRNIQQVCSAHSTSYYVVRHRVEGFESCHMRRELFLLLLLVNTLLSIAAPYQEVATPRQDSVVSQAYEWYPRYVTFLSPERLDSAWNYAYTDVVPIIYEVNKAVLIETEQLEEVIGVINRLKEDERVKLAYVWIGDSASPEGPIDNNQRLGQWRARVLADYIKRKTNLTDNDIRKKNLCEDWLSLSHLLHQMDFPKKEQVIEIISNEKDWARRKQKIQRLDKGETWKYLLHEVFPILRNARMVIVCSTEDIKPLLPPTPVEEPRDSIVALPFPSKEAVTTPRATPPEDRFWSIKTNGIYLGALIANAGFEVELWHKWSLDVPVWYSPYNYTPTRKIRLLATQSELRFWPKKAGRGHFFGLHTYCRIQCSHQRQGTLSRPQPCSMGIGTELWICHTFRQSQKMEP